MSADDPSALFFRGVYMITYSLVETAPGQWSVLRANFKLFDDLKLGPAIHLARAVAREEHTRAGRGVCVEMLGGGSTIRLAHYLPSA